jgi:hypothetical protein
MLRCSQRNIPSTSTKGSYAEVVAKFPWIEAGEKRIQERYAEGGVNFFKREIADYSN